MIRIAALQSITGNPIPCERGVRKPPAFPSRIGCICLAIVLLAAGCAPTVDEDVRLAGIGTPRAAPEPKPIPRFAGDGFVAADGQVLPLRKWLPRGEIKAVILALHGFNDYSHAFEAAGNA